MSGGLREADAIVVGTGAGGATAARTLARAGWSVLLVEEGPDRRATPGEATARDTMLGRFRDAGSLLSGGDVRIPLLQARMVGGSTAINSAIFWQLPEAVYAGWSALDPGLGRLVPWREIETATAEIERDLSVRPVDRAVLGNNSLRLERGAAALGLAGRVIRRAESGCEGSARCLQGCRNRRRQGMDVSYVPDAIAHGATLLADTKALRVVVRGGRAEGVETSRGFLRARRAVVLAAGAIHTPALLLASGVRGATGLRFTAHPGFSVMGMFDERVDTTFGATQGYEVTAVREQGLKIESLALPKAIAAARLPGAGAAFRALAERFDHVASWACLYRPERHGSVRASLLGSPRPRLTVTAADRARIRLGLGHLVDLMFAAGARHVFPGVAGFPSTIDSPAALAALGNEVEPSRLSMIATHLFGGAVLGTDASSSVVDPARFEVHGVSRLHVADASVIPTTLGVNPQGTIMALARIAAERIAGR